MSNSKGKITIATLKKQFGFDGMKKLVREFITGDHQYKSFRQFLEAEYNFSDNVFRRGYASRFFGPFTEINYKRKLYCQQKEALEKKKKNILDLKTKYEFEIEEMYMEKALTEGDKLDPEVHDIPDISLAITKKQEKLIVLKNNQQKAKEAKQALINSIYTTCLIIEKKSKSQKQNQFVAEFLIKNSKNLVELIQLLSYLEKTGNIDDKFKIDELKVVFNKNEFSQQNIHFETIKPENIVEISKKPTTKTQIEENTLDKI